MGWQWEAIAHGATFSACSAECHDGCAFRLAWKHTPFLVACVAPVLPVSRPSGICPSSSMALVRWHFHASAWAFSLDDTQQISTHAGATGVRARCQQLHVCVDRLVFVLLKFRAVFCAGAFFVFSAPSGSRTRQLEGARPNQLCLQVHGSHPACSLDPRTRSRFQRHHLKPPFSGGPSKTSPEQVAIMVTVHLTCSVIATFGLCCCCLLAISVLRRPASQRSTLFMPWFSAGAACTTVTSWLSLSRRRAFD